MVPDLLLTQPCAYTQDPTLTCGACRNPLIRLTFRKITHHQQGDYMTTEMPYKPNDYTLHPMSMSVLGLQVALGISAAFWPGVQSQYNLEQAEYNFFKTIAVEVHRLSS